MNKNFINMLKLNFVIILFLSSTLFSVEIYSQGMHLKIHMPKDSTKIDSLVGKSQKNYHIKLKMPGSVYEVENDSLKVIPHNPFEIKKGSNNTMLPSIKIPSYPKIKSPIDTSKSGSMVKRPEGPKKPESIKLKHKDRE